MKYTQCSILPERTPGCKRFQPLSWKFKLLQQDTVFSVTDAPLLPKVKEINDNKKGLSIVGYSESKVCAFIVLKKNQKKPPKSNFDIFCFGLSVYFSFLKIYLKKYRTTLSLQKSWRGTNFFHSRTLLKLIRSHFAL